MSTSPPVLYFSLPFNRNICCHHCCFRGNQAVINIKLINTFRYPVSRVQLCNAFESRELRDVILYKGVGRQQRGEQTGYVTTGLSRSVTTRVFLQYCCVAAPVVFACCKLWSALKSRRWFPCSADVQTIPTTTTG